MNVHTSVHRAFHWSYNWSLTKLFLIRYVSSRHGRTSNFLQTAIVTIINGWMLLSCIVGIRSSSVVIVVPVLSIIDPLISYHRSTLDSTPPTSPFDTLGTCKQAGKRAPWWGGLQGCFYFHHSYNRSRFLYSRRTYHLEVSHFTILVLEDIVVPVNKAIVQIFGTVSLFIYAVLTCCW